MEKRIIVYLSTFPLFLFLVLNNLLVIIGTKLGWSINTFGISLILTGFFLFLGIILLSLNVLLILISSFYIIKNRRVHSEKGIDSLNVRLALYIYYFIWSLFYMWFFTYHFRMAIIKGVLAEIIVMSLVMGISILTSIICIILFILNRIKRKHTKIS